VELEKVAEAFLQSQAGHDLIALADTPMRIMTVTTDVHQHGKMLLDTVFRCAGHVVEDGGVSSDSDDVVALVRDKSVDAIALSTYNGVALKYTRLLIQQLRDAGLDIPVLVGGRLNEIPEGSNTNLPVDVTKELAELGAIPCVDLAAASQALQEISYRNRPQSKELQGL